MKLVIAEKPSVAQSLGKVIGANKRQDGYLEGGGYLVSWCFGHLVELSAPERYDERFSRWRLEDLPTLIRVAGITALSQTYTARSASPRIRSAFRSR